MPQKKRKQPAAAAARYPAERAAARAAARAAVEMDESLRDVFYEARNPGSYGGVDSAHRGTKKKFKRSSVHEWLSHQDTYTAHKPAIRKFLRRRVVVGSIDQQFQADLVDVSKLAKFNNGYRYLLTCLDVLSKFAFVVPLKDKTGKSLVEAFKVIFGSGRKC